MEPGAHGKTRKNLKSVVAVQIHTDLSLFLSGHTQLPAPGEERGLVAFQHLQCQAEERARLFTGPHGRRTRDNGQKMKQEMFKL